MNTHKQRWSRAVILMALACMLDSPLVSRAQDAQDPAIAEDSNAPDPPSLIARLSFIDGSVSYQPGGENDWAAAMTNRPLVSGDNLWADANSRAEVHVGSTALRLGAQTGITLLEVSDHAAQIRLAQGELIVKVRHVDDDDMYEIDTPNVAFVVMQPGDYRFDVSQDGGHTNVTVWRGRGQATGGGSSYMLAAGQHAAFTGGDPVDNGQINFDLSHAPAGDDFDNWAMQRDRDEDESDAANYLSRDMSGYEDLDAYGSWTYVPGYGPCWQPSVVVAGWAPYHFGRWAWVGPWGWTWMADEPWGFAPFHYGRWANGANGWMWVPGPKAVRPVYAPALVAWLGGGQKSNFSFDAGVGWLPLAPGEVFIPGYRVSRSYVNRVNTTNTVVNVVRINDVYNTVVINRGAAANNLTYANRGVSGGVTVVTRETFVNGRAVASNAVSLPAKELASAPVSHTVAAEPVRASVTGSGKTIAIKPPATVTSRQVVALRTPAPAPQSFSQSQPHVGSQSNQSALVKQQAPGRPPSVPQASVPLAARTSRSQDSVHSIGESNPSTPSKPAARVWEAQGTPEPVQTQPATFNPETAPTPQSTKGARPVARPAAPTAHPVNQQQVREPEPKPRSWQSKPAPTTSTSHAQPHTSTTAPHVESAPKK